MPPDDDAEPLYRRKHIRIESFDPRAEIDHERTLEMQSSEELGDTRSIECSMKLGGSGEEGDFAPSRQQVDLGPGMHERVGDGGASALRP